MPFHVLNQRTAVLHVQNLQTPADSEDRQIAHQRLFNKGAFEFIARVVGFFGFWIGRFAVTGRINVGAAHQNQPVKTEEMISFNQFDACFLQSLNVRRGVGASDRNDFIHLTTILMGNQSERRISLEVPPAAGT